MQVTDEMVTRFLGWRLPDTFAPDCYISFDREGVKKMGNGTHWPVGTNLLTADEARAMLEHVLDDRPMQPTYYVQHPDGTYSKADPQPVSANDEILARDLCHRRGVDPDSMVDVDGVGTKRPLWMAWLPAATGDVRRAADEAREARAKELADAYREGWRDGAAAALDASNEPAAA